MKMLSEAPMSAGELLQHYAAGERWFHVASLCGADLNGANLSYANLNGANLVSANLSEGRLVGVNLSRASLVGVNFRQADLSQANLVGADLSRADLRGADLGGVSLKLANLVSADLSGADLRGADLSGADLRHANLVGANLAGANLLEADLSDSNLSNGNLGRANISHAELSGADLSGADLSEASLAGTLLLRIDLAPFCRTRASLKQFRPSIVDHSSIALSLNAPELAEFLVDTGMPHVYATYAIDSVRSLTEADLFQMLHSTFISYGGPDEPFAKRLHEALSANGVQTWFFPVNATPGKRIRETVHVGIQKHDRMLLVCSAASLDRPGVLHEIVEVLDRETREGGKSLLIPVVLDDYVFKAWNPPDHPGLVTTVRDRVAADFRELSQFDTQLLRLIDALKKVRPSR